MCACKCRPIFVCAKFFKQGLVGLNTSAEPIVSICVVLVPVFVSVCEGQRLMRPVFAVSQMSYCIFM